MNVKFKAFLNVVWLITLQLAPLNNSQTVIGAMPAGHGKPHLAHPWCGSCMHTVRRSWCSRILWAASERMWCWNHSLVSSSLAFFIWPPPWPITSHWLASAVMPFPPVPIPCNDFAMWCTLPSWRQRQLIHLVCQYTSTRLHGFTSSEGRRLQKWRILSWFFFCKKVWGWWVGCISLTNGMGLMNAILLAATNYACSLQQNTCYIYAYWSQHII